MAQKVLEAQQLVGQNRNTVSGQVDGQLVPTRLYNLAPHRAGGYAPFGRNARMTNDASANISLANIARLIGHDETGIASFSTTVAAPGALHLFHGTEVITQGHASYASPSDAVHMENAGAYISRDAYLVLDREDRTIEPIDAQVAAEPEVGEPVTVNVPDDTLTFVDVAYGNSGFLAIAQNGRTFRSTDGGGSWSEVGEISTTVKDNGVGNLVSVAFAGSRFVVSADNGTIYWTDDDGTTWNEVVVYASEGGDTGWPTHAVSAGGGDAFYLASDGKSGGMTLGPTTTTHSAYPTDSAGVARSLDGGETWEVIDSIYRMGPGWDHQWDAWRVAYHATTGYYLYNSMDDCHPFSDDSGTGLGFDYDDSGENGHYDNWRWTVAGFDRFYAIHSDGRIRQSGLLSADPDNMGRWSAAATLGGWPRKIEHNGLDNVLVVVGTDSSAITEPRVWIGDSPGTLSRNTDIEDAMAEEGCTYVNSVAFDDSGRAVYVGDGGVLATTTVTPGLDSGTYDLIYVSYFNTKAGRFVFDIQRETQAFSEDFGNAFSFQAENKASIIANNAWLNALPAADAEEIVNSLRLDVYVQHSPEVNDTDEEDLTYSAATAEHTIRYAFTVPFPEEGDGETMQDLGRTLNELPLGRQIVSEGVPTTVVFEKSRTEASQDVRSRTAVHNGRVWGLAAQDEDRWHEDDEISLEIANQFNRFVLTYTETGWANLVSDQNYVPIQPTQSSQFTGMLSTPSGLMVMFDNEIFLVDGDPAFGNLSVQLYLDMVGCDAGTVPCKMGGLPFTIWDGKIWALQAGQAQEISKGQWLPDDPFVRIAAEPTTRSLLALTESGELLRFLIDDQFWLTDPGSSLDNLTELLPSTGNTRFVNSSGDVWTTYTDGTPDTPFLYYAEMDFGQPERRTPLYVVKATVEGAIAALEYDRSAVGYDANAIPGLFYASAQANNGSLDTFDPIATGGLAPYHHAIGARNVRPLAFRLPLRQNRAYSMDVRLDLRGMGYGDVLKLPLRFFHAAGGETR